MQRPLPLLHALYAHIRENLHTLQKYGGSGLGSKSKMLSFPDCTMVQINQESRCKYWSCPFACSFKALTCLLALHCLLCSRTHYRPCRKVNVFAVFYFVLDQSEMLSSPDWRRLPGIHVEGRGRRRKRTGERDHDE